MEQRKMATSSSVRALPTRWRPNQVLPWICVVLIALTCSYGLQLTAAAILPSTAADQRGRTSQGAGKADVSDQHGPLVETAPISPEGIVTITGLEAATNDRMQLICIAAGDRLATGALVIALEELPDVVTHVCNLSEAPMIQRGSDY